MCSCPRSQRPIADTTSGNSYSCMAARYMVICTLLRVRANASANLPSWWINSGSSCGPIIYPMPPARQNITHSLEVFLRAGRETHWLIRPRHPGKDGVGRLPDMGKTIEALLAVVIVGVVEMKQHDRLGLVEGPAGENLLRALHVLSPFHSRRLADPVLVEGEPVIQEGLRLGPSPLLIRIGADGVVPEEYLSNRLGLAFVELGVHSHPDVRCLGYPLEVVDDEHPDPVAHDEAATLEIFQVGTHRLAGESGVAGQL